MHAKHYKIIPVDGTVFDYGLLAYVNICQFYLNLADFCEYDLIKSYSIIRQL